MNLHESDVTANGIRLHVYRTDTGKPPLVFAHGITDNGLCFSPIAAQLENDFEIILFDSRGHGKSEPPESKATSFDRARDLAGLINVLGLSKPRLIGHSMGAVTVMLFAGLYPQLPSRIVLEDPPPFEMLASVTDESLAARRQWRTFAAENKQKSIEQLIELNRRENPAWLEAERLPWAQSKQQYSLTVFDEGPIDLALAKQTISEIICPTLLLTADLDKGAMYPLAFAEDLVTNLPSARHIHISGAGHNIRRDQPIAFLHAVRSFLQGSV
jgi:pimeloyl-ACP methyl ester carboxylesterase